MGVVNNRIDIDALEKSSGGGGGEFTLDKIFDGNVVQGGSTAYTLTAPYTDYKFLVVAKVSGGNSEYGVPMITECIQTGNNNLNTSGIVNMRFDAEDATKFKTPSGSGTVAIKIYGAK